MLPLRSPSSSPSPSPSPSPSTASHCPHSHSLRSRPSLFFLAALILHIIATTIWVYNIPREQHSDGEIGAWQLTSQQRPHGSDWAQLLNARQSQQQQQQQQGENGSGSLLSAEQAAAAVAAWEEKLERAIQQFEQLKTDLRTGALPSLAPTSSPSSSSPSPSTLSFEPTPSATLSSSSPSPASSSSSSSSSISRQPRLIIGMPTMPRKADYLSTVLRALANQMISDPDDPMYGFTHVWVMNNAPFQGEGPRRTRVEHRVFEENKSRYADHCCFTFLENDHSLLDPLAANTPVEAGRPGDNVRKQTRDLVRLMQMVEGRSAYYMAMEDDFDPCPNMLRMIEHALRKAQREWGHSDTKPINPPPAFASITSPLSPPSPTNAWVTLKFSYGFNGFLLHNNEDLRQFGSYLLAHQARRPPDHLTTEWSCSETPASASYVHHRPHITYRYNLFHHLGTHSTLRSSLSPSYPSCFHVINRSVVFEIDAFDDLKCAHDDFTPCLPKDDPKRMPPYGIDKTIRKP